MYSDEKLKIVNTRLSGTNNGITIEEALSLLSINRTSPRSTRKQKQKRVIFWATIKRNTDLTVELIGRFTSHDPSTVTILVNDLRNTIWQISDADILENQSVCEQIDFSKYKRSFIKEIKTKQLTKCAKLNQKLNQ